MRRLVEDLRRAKSIIGVGAVRGKCTISDWLRGECDARSIMQGTHCNRCLLPVDACAGGLRPCKRQEGRGGTPKSYKLEVIPEANRRRVLSDE